MIPNPYPANTAPHKLAEATYRVPVCWVEMLARIADQLADTDPDSDVEIVVVTADHNGAKTACLHRIPVLSDPYLPGLMY